MSVGRKTGSKPLAFITSLMVLFALVVPFLGSAVAGHTGGVTVINLSDGDSAPANTCNEFTVQLFGNPNNNTPAEGETVTIQASQSDGDAITDNRIAFCDPDATGPGTDLSGADPVAPDERQTQGGGNPNADCDDSPGSNDRTGVTGCANTAGTESPATIFDTCRADQSGVCRFGVTSNEAGTMTVTAYRDTGAAGLTSADLQDVATKTWTAGAGTARNITCTPATDNNPEGTRHEFQCTVTDANGAAVAGESVTFDVTAGPNHLEVGPTTCGTATNASGQTANPGPENPPGSGQQPGAPAAGACGYNDVINADSPVGTDTITAWVNLPQQPGQPAPTPGLDAGEPRTTISKTWVGAARNIDCEPETASNEVGTSHTITCTVRDAAGNPRQGVNVNFTIESGPTVTGTGGQATDANGQARITISNNTDAATGTTVIRGALTQTAGTDECERTAGDPTPQSTAGNCFDDVSKTWTRTPGGGTRPQCNDGIDNDADGLIDAGNDPGCVSTDDTTESPNPGDPGVGEPARVATNLTIRYNRAANAFKGAVGSNRKPCQVGRTVILKKIVPGPNRTVGRDTSNRQGNWQINKRVRRGRFYAIALRQTETARNGQTLICLRDRSVTIKLRRR